MGPDGQWVPSDSAYGQGLLGDSRLFGSGMYDMRGRFIGSEGPDVADSTTDWAGGQGADWFGLGDDYATANDPTGTQRTAGNPFGLSVDVGE